MEENNENSVKICFVKNLPSLNFNSTVNIPIDSNINIKKVISVNSYLLDIKSESSNGKSIVSGKIGVKVVYIDNDNMTNTVNDNSSFSETIIDTSITSDSFVNILNSSIVSETTNQDTSIRIENKITINSCLYMNLAIGNSCETFENLIVKKDEISTSCIDQIVKTNFEYSTNFETKDIITKILNYNANFTLKNITPNDNYAIAEGTIFSTVLYECQENDEVKIKSLSENFDVKTDIQINNLSLENDLDLVFNLNLETTTINLDVDKDTNLIMVNNKVDVSGVALKHISLDVAIDIYSTENEITLSSSKRNYINNKGVKNFCEDASSEIVLNDSEPVIDEIICNINAIPEITNIYSKDQSLFLEGLVSSNVLYLDENKEIQQKSVQIPYVIDSKLDIPQESVKNVSININNCKIKSKRGNVIEIEYELCFNIYYYEFCSKEIVDNYNIGKPFDYSNYDYQIFLAKPEETIWDLSKRIKVSPDDLQKTNPNLPLVMEGNEKVIIKR